MLKRLHRLHPFLFALLPAVFLWGQNFGEVPLREVIPTLVVLLVFGGVVWSVFFIVFRDLEKSALMSSVFLTITLLFGYLYDVFFDSALIQLRFRWATVILFLVFVLLWYVTKKTTRDLSNVNTIVAVAAGVFLATSLFQVSVGYYNAYKDVQHKDVDIGTDISEETRELRDIYYIILDGYASPDVVKNVLGFEDIDRTVTFLEEKGFFIARESQSNYPATLLSLPSSLNMRYLADPSADRRHFALTENHAVKDILKSHGYTYMHFGADAFTYFNRYADRNITIGALTPYQTVVWHTTIFKPLQDLTGFRFGGLAEALGFLDNRRAQWEREQFKLHKLAEIADEEEAPVFAFAHFLLPKGLNVFDAEGNFQTEAQSREKGIVQAYLDQAAYINGEMEKLVTALLERPGLEPIIIIQGDHSFPFSEALDASEDFADPARARELVVPGKYSFPIFNAFFFPNGGDAALYNSITPVNTFRVLFHQYFGQELELLEDIRYTEDPDDASRFIRWDT